MNMPTVEAEDFYVCAGICRIDPETSACVGCGRPVVAAEVRTDATVIEKPDADSIDAAS